MRTSSLVLAALLVLPSAASLAEGDHKPRHGGVVVEVKEMQYELVVKPDVIALYLEDHGKAVDTRGFTAKVTLLAGKEKTEATLVPAGGNRLEAKGSFSTAAGTKAVAIVSKDGKSPVTVRFAVK